VNGIFEWLSAALAMPMGWALLAAAGWGLASIALSPCHLASVPLAIAFLQRDKDSSKWSLSLALGLGVLASLALIGVVTVAAGRIAGDLWGIGPWIGTLALFLAGLYLLGVLQVPTGLSINQERIPRNARGALIVGAFLGITLGPCSFAFFAPVFVASIDLASSQMLLASGLVAAFALGHTLGISLAGVFGIKLNDWFERREKRAASMRQLAGVLLLFSAFYLIATTP